MKVFVIFAVVLGVASVGQAGEDRMSKTPGCEKMATFKELTPKSCCETYPNLVDRNFMQQCGEACKSAGDFMEKKCCWTNCTLTLEKVLDSSKGIDTEAMIKLLNLRAKSSDAWVEPIKKSVEDCMKDAPDMLAKWKEKEPKVEKCEVALSMVTKHCISRNLFFNCPAKTGSTQCTDYEAFGKECPIFPHGGGGGRRGGKGGKGGKEKKAEESKDGDGEAGGEAE